MTSPESPSFKDELERTLIRVRVALENVDLDEVTGLCTAIARASRIFVAGAGRSGQVVRSFATRLTRAGHAAHVAFEPTCPGVAAGDLMLVCSGSGTTPTMLAVAHTTKEARARLAVITASALSPLGRMADQRVLVPPVLPLGASAAAAVLSPVQTLFEQAAYLLLDTIAVTLGGGPHGARSSSPSHGSF